MLRAPIATSVLLLLAVPVSAQVTWQTTTPIPMARDWHTFDHDFVRNEAVVFGGTTPFVPFLLGDTWIWDGTTWTAKSPSNPPCPRFQHAMSFDGTVPGRSMVMFGGLNAVLAGVPLDDTWIWDGAEWQPINLAVRPSPRSQAAMAFDLQSRRLLMHGGLDGAGNTLDDTWSWNGSTWTPLGSSGFPRRGHRMSFAVSPQGAGLHIFGGTDGTHYRSELLFFDGSGWVADTVLTGAPPARSDFGMTFDYFRRRLVIAGGLGMAGVLGDTWEMYDNQWVLRQPVPGLRVAAFDMDFFDSQRRTVQVGGLNQGFVVENLTRTYGPQVFGSFVTSQAGCPGSQGNTPTFRPVPSNQQSSGQPWAGQTLDVVIDGLLPSTGNVFGYLAGAAAIPPVDLTPIGAPGCSLYVNVATAVALGLPAASATGTTTWQLPIPSTAPLGVPLHFQVFQVDIPANPFGVVFSNHALGTIGGL